MGLMQLNRLALHKIKNLSLEKPIVQGSGSYMSAASGLVKQGESFHVVADDSLHLGTFPVSGDESGQTMKLLKRDELPSDEKARKALKPDLESLTAIKLGERSGLISLGSGSKENRRTGVFLDVDGDGELGRPVEFDLAPLYSHLGKQFPELNIEGVAPVGKHLRLLQRGNGTTGPNAVIDLDLEKAVQAAAAGESFNKDLLVSIKPVDLGTTPGRSGEVPWTFTDLAALPGGRSVFTAAAEDTDNPYEDGEILGSAIGFLSPDGSVEDLRVVDQRVKLEGIATEQHGDNLTAYLVTDPDDPHQAAGLYKTDLI